MGRSGWLLLYMTVLFLTHQSETSFLVFSFWFNGLNLTETRIFSSFIGCCSRAIASQISLLLTRKKKPQKLQSPPIFLSHMNMWESAYYKRQRLWKRERSLMNFYIVPKVDRHSNFCLKSPKCRLNEFSNYYSNRIIYCRLFSSKRLPFLTINVLYETIRAIKIFKLQFRKGYKSQKIPQNFRTLQIVSPCAARSPSQRHNAN